MRDTSLTISARPIGSDTEVLGTFYEVPGLGGLPINAFLLRAEEPVLVDTGYARAGATYFDAIRAAIDLRELRWIWLTHADPDHTGCLREVLDAAPRARLVTSFLGLGKLGLSGPIPTDRVYLINPGQRLLVGDRELLAVRPATFDAPETTGFFDAKTKVLFSADSFGALMEAPAQNARDVAPARLRDGMITWSTIDSPWLPWTRAEAFDAELARIRDLGASMVLSTHLPPAAGMMETLLANVHDARSAKPWVGPDQEALMHLLAEPTKAAA